MTITPELVKDLREKTGAGMLDCKKALEESSGNVDKAIEFLRKKGLASAAKKVTRNTKDGLIGQYIHAGGKLGVLVEVSCETDFVARTEEFQNFVRDMAMQVAAANPIYVRREEVPANVLESEKEIYRSQAKESKKPEAIIEKIVSGKIESYFRDTCLLEQQFVKNPDKTVAETQNELIGKLGENMSIRRFARFQLGETSST
ncbi:MAG: translation elongation factor Ts [Pseudomonadota bacterium]